MRRVVHIVSSSRSRRVTRIESERKNADMDCRDPETRGGRSISCLVWTSCISTLKHRVCRWVRGK